MGTVNKQQEIDMRQVLEELRSIKKKVGVNAIIPFLKQQQQNASIKARICLPGVQEPN